MGDHQQQPSLRQPRDQVLQHRWSVSYPYDPATGAAGTTEPINEREILYPHTWVAWRPFDNLADDYCDLADATVRVSLEATDAVGNTGADAVLLRTQPCIVVD